MNMLEICLLLKGLINTNKLNCEKKKTKNKKKIKIKIHRPKTQD